MLYRVWKLEYWFNLTTGTHLSRNKCPLFVCGGFKSLPFILLAPSSIIQWWVTYFPIRHKQRICPSVTSPYRYRLLKLFIKEFVWSERARIISVSLNYTDAPHSLFIIIINPEVKAETTSWFHPFFIIATMETQQLKNMEG